MIYTNHIIAKGMPAAQAAAGQRAPMLISVGMLFGMLRSLRRALECARNATGDSARMFGFANTASLVSTVSKTNGHRAGFGYLNPPHRYDNSSGKARLKLR
jgi:hypothetical protein